MNMEAPFNSSILYCTPKRNVKSGLQSWLDVRSEKVHPIYEDNNAQVEETIPKTPGVDSSNLNDISAGVSERCFVFCCGIFYDDSVYFTGIQENFHIA